MDFEILGEITGVENIARGSGIREIVRLRNRYGVVDGENGKVMLKYA